MFNGTGKVGIDLSVQAFHHLRLGLRVFFLEAGEECFCLHRRRAAGVERHGDMVEYRVLLALHASNIDGRLLEVLEGQV